MKTIKQFKLLTILGLSALFFSACSNDDSPSKSSSGIDTNTKSLITFKVDGVEKSQNLKPTTNDEEYMFDGGLKYSNFKGKDFVSVNFINPNDENETFVFHMYSEIVDVPVSEGEYLVVTKDSDADKSVNFAYSYKEKDEDKDYFSGEGRSGFHSGSAKITKLDTEKKYIEGTFQVNVGLSGGGPVKKITEGKFSGTYYVDNN